ncbi:MAG: cytochrome-c peroxidase [Saprospiraceae bacterium]
MKQLIVVFVLLVSFFSSVENAEVNLSTIESKADLGQRLFFDPILSLDNSISCASCHIPEFAFADTIAFSKGVGDSIGTRNTPSLMNLAYSVTFFYDGRSATLEEQAKEPIKNPLEMHLDYEIAVERVQADTNYQKLFSKIYQSAPDSANILNSLAEFQKTLESNGSSPHDLWITDADPDALTESQIRGRALFIKDGMCFDCHFGPFFTGDEFRNVGLYNGKEFTDSGRFEITKDSTDLGKFKTPGLRNVALTAPYMHDGRFQTLEEVVEFYSDPYKFVRGPVNMDPLVVAPFHFTEQEKKDLVNFLHSLTDTAFDFEMQ